MKCFLRCYREPPNLWLVAKWLPQLGPEACHLKMDRREVGISKFEDEVGKNSNLLIARDISAAEELEQAILTIKDDVIALRTPVGTQ